MSFVDDLTVMILTYNEEQNIGRTLAAVGWAQRILVVDSGSTDSTLDIVARYRQARVVTRAFDSFAGQCNFGLTHIATNWVLSMDADYVVSEPLALEIQALNPSTETAGYRAAFIYMVQGRRLRATLYPPRTALYRKARAHYQDIGHGHRVTVTGVTDSFSAPIYHDDRKPHARWLASQQRYAAREADYLLSTPQAALGRNDRIRRMGWPAPMLVFVYTLLVKRCILDGWAGWHYVLQRTMAETMIALEVVDRRLQGRSEWSNAP